MLARKREHRCTIRRRMSRSLTEVTQVLQNLAALEWAQRWDNVGLLVEPCAGEVATVLITIDLTEDVLIEAKAAKADLIVAYHPIIFSGHKRLTQKTAAERIVIESIRSGIAIYSPHTALDAALWGMNDWLAQAVGKGVVAPIVPQTLAPAGTGIGRTVQLEQPRTLEELIATIKQHLGIEQLRVATASQHRYGAPIRSAAVCAGAGGSVFQHVESVDLLLTGEMRHHDILARVAAGTSVILADHTNTERGYLPHLAKWLADALGGDVNVVVSSADSEPLKIL